MACSLDQRRGIAYPSVSAADAQYGFNLMGGFIDPVLLQAAADAGATMVRFQPAWHQVENYDTGAMALPAATIAGLDKCAELGLRPIIVAAYGPPAKVTNSPLLTSDAPVGSYELRISPAEAAAIDPPFCHIMKFPNTKINASGKWGFPGSLIHSVDAEAGILTLASKTTIALTAGTKMYVQRYKYASLADQNPANEGVLAYVAYCEFLADEIASRGMEGFVQIWNEPPWLNERWDSRAAWYDAPIPPGLVLSSNIVALIKGCMASRPPSGVRYINSGPSKTSGQSFLVTVPTALATDVSEAVAWESLHTYHVNPEGFLWDPSGSDSGPWAMNPGDIGGNFRFQVPRAATYAATHGGVKPRFISTECGTGNPTGIGDATSQQGHAARARYLVRRVLTQWGCGVPPVVYALAAGSVFDVVNRTTYEKYPAYFALQRLAALVARVGDSWPSVWAPSVVGVPHGPWPTMSMTVHGRDGAVTFAWQRTFSEPKAPVTWGLIPSPAPVDVQLSLTPGSMIEECVNVVTGDTVVPEVDGDLVAVPITDEVIALRVVGS